MLTKKHIIKYKSKLLRKSWLLLLGFIFLFGVANAGSIDVHKVKGNAENNTLPVEYALLGTDYAVTDFVTYANSASEVPPVIRKYSSYFGIIYTMGRIGGSLYSSAKLAIAEEAAFSESAAKASTSEITTEETATATTVTSTEEKVTATSTEETAPTTTAKETTASEGTTTGTTTKENVPVETKTTEINDGSLAKGADDVLEEINRIKNLRKINLTKRIEELGKDLDKGGTSLIEGKAGAEIEESYGYFKRYKSTLEKKGDWVSLNGEYAGKTFDEFGGNLGQAALNEFVRKPSQKTKFFQQIDNHFLKADYVVLNLSEMKRLEPSLYEETLKYITNKFGNSKLINITK